MGSGTEWGGGQAGARGARGQRVAIVGAGVSGLVAARELHQRHEVSVFEAADRPGGHANTVEVELEGERHCVDTGFIVYNERSYPHFTRLLARLGVETQPTDMSFSVCCERSGLEWGSRGPNALFAQRRNLLRPSFHRLLRDVLRFNREAPRLLEVGDEKTSLGDHLAGGGYSRELVEHYVLPMGAAIWSADPADFLRIPAASFVRFFSRHGLLDPARPLRWRVVRGGSRRYVEALVAGFRERIRLGTRVRSVRRHARGVELETADGRAQRFDRVILATHSDQALALLADPSPAERALLEAIRYQRNDVVLHTDARLLPARRRAWSSWNYRIPADPQGGAVVTYHMNRLQGIRSRSELLVSLNAGARIDPARVLARFVYHHPVLDAEAVAAQRLHDRIDGARRTHFCGAYWGWGFHEDGVRSALEACRRLEAA
jgi:predicted NAD/FAD-binding protein